MGEREFISRADEKSFDVLETRQTLNKTMVGNPKLEIGAWILGSAIYFRRTRQKKNYTQTNASKILVNNNLIQFE